LRIASGVTCVALGVVAGVYFTRPASSGEAKAALASPAADGHDDALHRRLALLEGRVATVDRALAGDRLARLAAAETAAAARAADEASKAAPEEVSPAVVLQRHEEQFSAERDSTPWAQTMEAKTPRPSGLRSLSCRGASCRIEVSFPDEPSANQFFDDFEASPVAAGTTLIRFPPSDKQPNSVLFITRDQTRIAAE
jgi:hypothetical protein